MMIRISENCSVIEGITLLRFNITDLHSFEKVCYAMLDKPFAIAYIPVNHSNRFIFRQIYSIFTRKNGKIRNRFVYGSGYVRVSMSHHGKLTLVCGSDESNREQILEVTF